MNPSSEAESHPGGLGQNHPPGFTAEIIIHVVAFVISVFPEMET